MSTIDVETTNYYERYMNLFATDGWQQFKEEIKTSLQQDQQSAVTRCNTSDLWFEERGAQTAKLRILGFENAIKNSYDNLINEATDVVDPE